MKYYIVTSTIRDGEYEYIQQTMMQASNQERAGNKVAKDLDDWVKDDYREFEIDRAEELTEEEYKILNKYVM